MKSKGKPFFSFLTNLVLVNVVLLGCIGAYLVASFLGKVPMNRIEFMALLAVSAIVNLAFMLILWRRRSSLSLSAKIAAVLWSWFVFWFWVFAPPYFLLVMNVDTLQLQWITLAFTWEVMSMGAGFVLFCHLRFKPVQKFLDSPKEIGKEEAVLLYRRATRFPLITALIIIVLSALGFIMGETQARMFAQLPYIEGFKNYFVGFVVSVFLSVIYYVSVRYLLDAVCSELEEKAEIVKRARASIAQRVIFLSVMVVIGSVFLLQLIVIKSFQTIVRDEVAATLAADISQSTWSNDIRTHSSILLDPNAKDLDQLAVTPQSEAFIERRSTGIIDDFQDHIKLIGFFTDPASGQKSVAVVSLSNYYGPLTRTILSFLIGAFFVLLAGLGIAALAALALTQSIQILIKAIHTLDSDPKAAMPKIATGDEIEELSDALGFFVRQSQKLDQEKDEFISVASHQLRTPLAAMKWITNMLKTNEFANDAERMDFIDKAGESTDRMISLTNDLLETDRLQSGRVEFTFASVDVTKILEVVISELKPKMDSKQLNLSLNFVSRAAVRGDAEKLQGLFQNILENAMKYTPASGTIKVGTEIKGDFLEISIQDNGIGIPEDQKSQLFTKFFRARNAVPVDTTGSGLGLFIAKRIVEKHGGSIHFESEEGKGTSFIVQLPLFKY